MPNRDDLLRMLDNIESRDSRPSGSAGALNSINVGSRAAEDMALLGLGDEIYSGAMAVPMGLLEYATSDDQDLGLLSAIGQQYGDRVRRMDDIRRREYESAPVAAAVGSVGGALAGGPRMIGEAMAPAVARMPMGGIGRAIGWGGVGAAEGAVVGAATAPPGDRTPGAVEGGAIGTGFGALGSAAGDLGGAALRRVVGRDAGQSRTSAEMERALDEAGVTPQQAQQRIHELGPESVLADVDPRLRSLGEDVANRSAAVRARAEEILGPRQADQSRRLTQTVRDATGADGSAFAAADEIARRKADIARQPLQQARQQGFQVTEDIQNLLRRPAIQRAHEAAQRKAANEGVELPSIYSLDADGNQIVNPDLDPQQLFGAFDYIRRQLNQQGAMANNQLALAQASASGRSADVEDAIAASRLAGEWRDALRDQNQPYGDFLRLYADEFANERAMSAGQLLWRRRSDGREVDRIISDIDDMSQTELAYFREGFTQSLIDQLENRALTGQAARSLLRTPRMQDVLRRVITGAADDPRQGDAAYEAFSRALEAEIDMGETFRRTLTGSPTAQRLAGAERMDEDPRSLIGNLASGNVGSAMGQVAQAVGRRAGNLTPSQEAELGRMLFTPGLDQNRLILEGIMRRQGINQIGQTGIPSGVMGAGVAEGARQN